MWGYGSRVVRGLGVESHGCRVVSGFGALGFRDSDLMIRNRVVRGLGA